MLNLKNKQLNFERSSGPREIHDPCVSGQFLHLNEQVLINVMT